MTLKEAVAKTKYFVLDMDGTIYVDRTPIGDMVQTLNKIRDSGRKIIFLTNNSSKSKETYEEKLRSMNLYDDRDYIYTSGMACKDYLLEFRKGKSVNLLGTKSLRKEFLEAGIKLVEGVSDIAVLSYDTELTYKDVCDFTLSLVNGAEYIATHPDINCPGDPIAVPDAGSFIAMFNMSTGRQPSIIIGKPSDNMGKTLKIRFHAESEEFMMVGDRLYTDIAFGLNCGFHALLVLSGESTMKDVDNGPVKPNYILDSLNDVVDLL